MAITTIGHGDKEHQGNNIKKRIDNGSQGRGLLQLIPGTKKKKKKVTVEKEE